MFRKILCPIDFSAGSQQAMRLAVQLAVEANAELVLAHAWQLPRLAFAGVGPIPADSLDAMIQEGEAALADVERAAADLGARRVTARFMSGVPWEQIVDTARAETFDLVVMGTHGRTGLKHVLLGSVAEKVVRHAPCSVLVVR